MSHLFILREMFFQGESSRATLQDKQQKEPLENGTSQTGRPRARLKRNKFSYKFDTKEIL